MSKKIICGVATILGRQKSFTKTFNTIINQVDELIIYQNGFKDLSRLYGKYKHKLTIYSSLDNDIDMGDGGKFFKISEYNDVYYFSIDDDILYPNDYVKSTIEYSKEFKDKYVLTYHGRTLNSPDYSDILNYYRCFDSLDSIKEVQFPGTGVTMIPTKICDFNFKNIYKENMCDIWLGKYCFLNNNIIKVLPHKKDWLKQCEDFDLNDTIYHKITRKPNSYRDMVIRDMFLKK